jgi:hypothetical protein
MPDDKSATRQRRLDERALSDEMLERLRAHAAKHPHPQAAIMVLCTTMARSLLAHIREQGLGPEQVDTLLDEIEHHLRWALEREEAFATGDSIIQVLGAVGAEGENDFIW